jgi:thioredoxin-like negative regulator of GroEL
MVRFAAVVIALTTCLLGQAVYGDGPILLLDFSSPTCGPCRQLEPLIQAHEQAGYPIRKVDTASPRCPAS